MAISVHPDQIADLLLENGERFVTTERLAELLGVPADRVSRKLTEPRRRHEIVSVTKGGWAPVPVYDRKMRQAPMVADYLDEMMQFLGHEYYAGYVWAANLYGSHHYSWSVHHVVTQDYHRSRVIGRIPLHFIRGVVNPAKCIRRVQEYDNTVLTVSTPEATIFDLVARHDIVCGFHHVATLIGDMVTTEGLLDGRQMVSTAAHYPRAVSQRVGYISEIMGGHLAWACSTPLDLAPLADYVNTINSREVTLSGKPALVTDSRRTPTGRKWGVLVDHVIDPAHKSRCSVAA